MEGKEEHGRTLWKTQNQGLPDPRGHLCTLTMPPCQSPAWRMWSACALPTATGSPRISSALILRCPSPALPPEPWESRMQGAVRGISAGGYRQVSGTVVPGPTGASRGHHEWLENSRTNQALIYPCSGWGSSPPCLSVKWAKVTQLCPTLCDPMDCIVRGILQARILEWVAFPISRGSSQPRDWTQISGIASSTLPAESQGMYWGMDNVVFKYFFF